LLVLLATFGSLRWGELVGLRRENFDLSACVVRVIETTAELDRGGLVAETAKSKAGRRTVAFPAELVPELRWHLDRFAAPGERVPVFVGPKGATLRRSNFPPIWNAACEQAGIPGLHFHDLRHVGGTLAAATGASLKELMVRVGHSCTRAAMIYQHATRDRDEAIAKALGGLIYQVRSEPADWAGEGIEVRLVARLWHAGLQQRSMIIAMQRGIGPLSWGFRVGAGEGNRTLMTSLEGWGNRGSVSAGRPCCSYLAVSARE
jgi:hypothetical protein